MEILLTKIFDGQDSSNFSRSGNRLDHICNLSVPFWSSWITLLVYPGDPNAVHFLISNRRLFWTTVTKLSNRGSNNHTLSVVSYNNFSLYSTISFCCSVNLSCLSLVTFSSSTRWSLPPFSFCRLSSTSTIAMNFSSTDSDGCVSCECSILPWHICTRFCSCCLLSSIICRLVLLLCNSCCNWSLHRFHRCNRFSHFSKSSTLVILFECCCWEYSAYSICMILWTSDSRIFERYPKSQTLSLLLNHIHSLYAMSSCFSSICLNCMNIMWLIMWNRIKSFWCFFLVLSSRRLYSTSSIIRSVFSMLDCFPPSSWACSAVAWNFRTNHWKSFLLRSINCSTVLSPFTNCRSLSLLSSRL